MEFSLREFRGQLPCAGILSIHCKAVTFRRLTWSQLGPWPLAVGTWGLKLSWRFIRSLAMSVDNYRIFALSICVTEKVIWHWRRNCVRLLGHIWLTRSLARHNRIISSYVRTLNCWPSRWHFRASRMPQFERIKTMVNVFFPIRRGSCLAG